MPPTTVRHPLGLPAGSVRTILALMITAMIWLLLLVGPSKQLTIPLNHHFLMFLVMLVFVSHRPQTADDEPLTPMGIPIVLVRLFILFGTAAVLGYLYFKHRADLWKILTPPADQLENWPGFLLAMGGGFGVGYLTRLGPWKDTFVYQDLQAWVSILAMLGLIAELIIRLFINPNLRQEFDTFPWECLLTGLIAFYFGSRG